MGKARQPLKGGVAQQKGKKWKQGVVYHHQLPFIRHLLITQQQTLPPFILANYDKNEAGGLKEQLVRGGTGTGTHVPGSLPLPRRLPAVQPSAAGCGRVCPDRVCHLIAAVGMLAERLVLITWMCPVIGLKWLSDR